LAEHPRRSQNVGVANLADHPRRSQNVGVHPSPDFLWGFPTFPQGPPNARFPGSPEWKTRNILRGGPRRERAQRRRKVCCCRCLHEHKPDSQLNPLFQYQSKMPKPSGRFARMGQAGAQTTPNVQEPFCSPCASFSSCPVGLESATTEKSEVWECENCGRLNPDETYDNCRFCDGG
jgi:hypothetical protein